MLLPSRFEAEHFTFSSQLYGTREPEARWRRCLDLANVDLGWVLGQRYVAAAYSQEAEGVETLRIASALLNALDRSIKEQPWLSEGARHAALQKLLAIHFKVGRPDTWPDRSALVIERGDAWGNSLRAALFEQSREWARLEAEADREEWAMLPQEVNARFSVAPGASVTLPASILQSPFLDPARDDALSFGGLGTIIGHEFMHAFDDSGHRMDADARSALWPDQDRRAYEKRAACFVDQYAAYTAPGGVRSDGRLAQGENIADSEGLRLAYRALRHVRPEAPVPPRSGDLTRDQRFFLAFAQSACSTETEEFTRLLVEADTHAPARYRVNAAVANMPEFREAFHCPAGAPMVRPEPCRIW
jgi:endothelin-converting enzyme/putative endopeptidase